MGGLLLAFTPRYITLTVVVVATIALGVAMALNPSLASWLGIPLVIGGGLTALGLRDLTQTRHAILRNYPIAAHLRFLFEGIRPEMRQYFFESEKDGTPFSRDQRALVYQRANLLA